MNSGRVLSFCLSAVSVAAPWTVGCQAAGDFDPYSSAVPPPASQQPPPASNPPIDPSLPVPSSPTLPMPPPISGGSLLVLHDGNTAVAADPDRDMVWVVDLAGQAVIHSIQLQPGDEPGRLVEDAAGHVHVALRRGGALVSIDPTAGTIVARRPVCAAPRGLAYDAALDAIHVACADGILATFPAAGGAAIRVVQPDVDLRDVIVQNGVLYVSRFREAELLQLAADGTVAERFIMSTAVNVAPMGTTTNVPEVAYRTVALPGGGLAMLHQRAQQEAVDITTQGGYAGNQMCPGVGIVQNTVSFITPGAVPAVGPPLGMLTLAVDMAISADGTQVAIAAPGSEFGTTVGTYPTSVLQAAAVPLLGDCAMPSGQPLGGGEQVIAVAFDGQGNVIAQTRAPATISFGNVFIPLPGEVVTNDGHVNFHAGTKAGIACASCHPEGGDDGHVWQFTGLGARRTQNLRGGVLARMPFHWSGDIANMDDLVSVVLVGRMAGPSLNEQQTADLGQWMDSLPSLTPAAPLNPTDATRGAAIFHDPAVGCTTCHDGAQLSNHRLVDVGTSGVFKVPSLIGVGYRAPYLHDGCAATLLDRFADPTCSGGEQHGHTAHLEPREISDLVAYLQSL